jgi:hypothetical protein
MSLPDGLALRIDRLLHTGYRSEQIAEMLLAEDIARGMDIGTDDAALYLAEAKRIYGDGWGSIHGAKRRQRSRKTEHDRNTLG